MRAKLHSLIFCVLVCLLGCRHNVPIHQLNGTPDWDPDAPHSKELQKEEGDGNGIEVGSPKIYDDASLRMMLDATRAKLGAMTGLNQDALVSRLGSVSGATINQTQFGLQVTGGAGPSNSTTSTGATNSVTTNGSLPTGNTTIPGTVTVTTDPTQSVVTTSATPPTPPTVSSGLAFTPPSSVTPSSLDVLNEQMQLSYEMTNLELLLEGALSDRFVINQRFVKPKVTLGFPISLRTPVQFKDAVAVVEVEVTTSAQNLSDPNFPEPPAITALLPREKTYNVAAMTDNMYQIGGGAVVGSIGVAASYLKGHKILYLVQDQDTVALQRPDSGKANSTSFLWEFRPVFGQHFVRGGLKQTFVQLALPILDGVDCFGTVRIRTYWRRFDQKNGVSREVIPESMLVSKKTFPIPRYDLTPTVGAITYEDLGDGTVLTTVTGNYLAGTYVQLGPTRYDAGKNLLVEDAGVKFTAPISALGQWTGHIVARSGVGSALLNPLAQTPLQKLNQTACVDTATHADNSKQSCPTTTPAPTGTCPGTFTIEKVTVEPLDETESKVRVEVTATTPPVGEKPLLQIGNKVLGLNDAPIRRSSTDSGWILTAAVPTGLLLSHPEIRVFLPFWSDVSGTGLRCYDASEPLTEKFGLDSAADHFVLVSVDQSGNAVYLLYGNNLEKAKLLIPENGALLEAVDSVPRGRVRLLRITKSALQVTKKVVLQKQDGQRPLVLDLPDTRLAAPKVSVDSPIVQNTDQLDITVEDSAAVISVKFNDKALHKTIVDRTTIRLAGLKSAGVTNEQKTRELTIEFKGGVKASVKFEVVAARIGVKSSN